MFVDLILLYSELIFEKNTIKSTVKQRQILWEKINGVLNSEVDPKNCGLSGKS